MSSSATSLHTTQSRRLALLLFQNEMNVRSFIATASLHNILCCFFIILTRFFNGFLLYSYSSLDFSCTKSGLNSLYPLHVSVPREHYLFLYQGGDIYLKPTVVNQCCGYILQVKTSWLETWIWMGSWFWGHILKLGSLLLCLFGI